MVRLTKVGILSYGYVTAIISAIVSFLYILLMLPMIQKLFQLFTQRLSGSMDYGYGMGMDSMSQIGFGQVSTGLFVTLIILAPIIGAITGFIGGCLGAIFYNLAAKWTGGVKCNFEKVPEINYSGKSSAYIEEDKSSSQSESSPTDAIK
jgi:hypothetical protein